MKHTEMTIAEMLAWKSGNFEEYRQLLSRKHWLESHLRGEFERMYSAQDSMSVFGEDEKDDPTYLKYAKAFDKESAKAEKHKKELNQISERLLVFMKRKGETR